METLRKSSAASISSMTYSGVGRYTCSANTSDSDDSVFSPPLRLPITFHDFLGGRTENATPSLNGSSESTSSNSASPPSVSIWYISFSWREMSEKPAMNSTSRCLRTPS